MTEPEAYPEYNPTPDERQANVLMGLEVALQTVQAMKRSSAPAGSEDLLADGNPQWDPSIEFLQAAIDEIKNS